MIRMLAFFLFCLLGTTVFTGCSREDPKPKFTEEELRKEAEKLRNEARKEFENK